MGFLWHKSGKHLNKKNTINDYIDCAKYLIDEKYTSPELMVGQGTSAGGGLMAAVANEAPQYFRALILHVPACDYINSLLDSTSPSSQYHYQEIGNPYNKTDYNYMKSYNPYHNIKKQNYPAMLITSSLNDSRVDFWEPTKYTAKLRAHKTDNNPLILKTNLYAGHFGSSGRYKNLWETAYEYAFVLDLLSKESAK